MNSARIDLGLTIVTYKMRYPSSYVILTSKDVNDNESVVKNSTLKI